jgi:ABC-type sugar transport system ATPase subunit
MDNEPKQSVKNIFKRFGGLVALKGVDFDLHTGEVVSQVGDNGAGKSTLIKCISGVYLPVEGSIQFIGNEVSFSRPILARNAGIETIYQDLALT